MTPLLAMKQVPLKDRAQFELFFVLEHYLRKNERIARQKEKARLRIADHVTKQGKGKAIQVERLTEKISPEDFFRRYLSKGVPVILDKAAADWTCVREWSFDAFKQRFGPETIKLVQKVGLSDDDFIDEREFSEEIEFGAFLDQVLSGGRKYMRFSPLLEKFPELAKDFDKKFLREMSGNSWGITYELFIGGKGTITPLHNAMTPFFFVNVCGIKHWTLIPCRYLAIMNPPADGANYNHSDVDLNLSNVDRFPGLDCIDRMEAVLGPSDVLFNPAWMWHCVQNEAPTIGVRCGFINIRTMISESPTLAFIRVFAARNPSLPEALYYAMFKKNLAQREKRLNTASIFRT
jgi:hypothetical protein